MKLSLEEMTVISNAILPVERGALAIVTAAKLENPRFDCSVAMKLIDDLTLNRYLNKNSNGRYTATLEGKTELKNAFYHLQSVMVHLYAQSH